jgi:hypothetical protein
MNLDLWRFLDSERSRELKWRSPTAAREPISILSASNIKVPLNG